MSLRRNLMAAASAGQTYEPIYLYTYKSGSDFYRDADELGLEARQRLALIVNGSTDHIDVRKAKVYLDDYLIHTAFILWADTSVMMLYTDNDYSGYVMDMRFYEDGHIYINMD